MKWAEEKIGSFCDTGSGGTPSRDRAGEFYGGSIPWVKSGELRESVIYQTGETLTEAGVANSSAKIVPPGALLVAMYGATVGRVGILGIQAATNQAICHIIPRGQHADTRYLFHCLQAKLPVFLSRSVGGAQPNISQEIIKDTSVPLPPLEEQRRIAAILDKADALRQKRRAALQKLDSLTQSLFLDMFGDPESNHWPRVALPEIVHYQEGPGIRNWQFRQAGVKLVNVKNIVQGVLITENTERYLDPDEVHRKYDHFLLDAGDFVIASSGVTWGKIAEVNDHHLPLCLNTSMIRIRPKNGKILKPYLRKFIESIAFRSQIERLITGSAQPNFGPAHLRQVVIPLPPIELQELYLIRAASIDEI